MYMEKRIIICKRNTNVCLLIDHVTKVNGEIEIKSTEEVAPSDATPMWGAEHATKALGMLPGKEAYAIYEATVRVTLNDIG
ncbi:MAG: hypothetical protein EOM21_17725 [Gammaproteobacteria bacterium]|nr:hypothetical protein [Gammaproteobacteria bacterium]